MSATAAPVRLPTPEQMKAYADELPEIYREIVQAIQRADPERRYGHGISPRAVLSELAKSRLPFNRREFLTAVEQLMELGFLKDFDDGEFWLVTDLGEDLVATVTGLKAKRVEVPPLPKPKW